MTWSDKDRDEKETRRSEKINEEIIVTISFTVFVGTSTHWITWNDGYFGKSATLGWEGSVPPFTQFLGIMQNNSFALSWYQCRANVNVRNVRGCGIGIGLNLVNLPTSGQTQKTLFVFKLSNQCNCISVVVSCHRLSFAKMWQKRRKTC